MREGWGGDELPSVDVFSTWVAINCEGQSVRLRKVTVTVSVMEIECLSERPSVYMWYGRMRTDLMRMHLLQRMLCRGERGVSHSSSTVRHHTAARDPSRIWVRLYNSALYM